MGDEGEFWRDVKAARRERREKYGKPCPQCVALLPRAYPSILMPGGRCKIHNYRDPRPWSPESAL